MTAIFGMMAMMPILFGSAGYVLVSSAGTTEYKGYETDERRDRDPRTHPPLG